MLTVRHVHAMRLCNIYTKFTPRYPTIPWDTESLSLQCFSVQDPRVTSTTAYHQPNHINWYPNIFYLQEALYPYTFLVFMALLACFWTFTFFFVPETKGRTIEEITGHFRSGGNSRFVLYRGLRRTNQDGAEVVRLWSIHKIKCLHACVLLINSMEYLSLSVYWSAGWCKFVSWRNYMLPVFYTLGLYEWVKTGNCKMIFFQNMHLTFYAWCRCFRNKRINIFYFFRVFFFSFQTKANTISRLHHSCCTCVELVCGLFLVSRRRSIKNLLLLVI